MLLMQLMLRMLMLRMVAMPWPQLLRPPAPGGLALLLALPLRRLHCFQRFLALPGVQQR